MHRHRITADQVFRFPDTPLPPPETVTQPRQEVLRASPVTVSGSVAGWGYLGEWEV